MAVLANLLIATPAVFVVIAALWSMRQIYTLRAKEESNRHDELQKSGYFVLLWCFLMMLLGYVLLVEVVIVFLVRKLKSIGFNAAILINVGFRINNLAAAGFATNQMRAAKYMPLELKRVGYTLKGLVAAGYSPIELKAAGYSIRQMANAGLTIQVLQSSFDIQSMMHAGFFIQEFINANVPLMSIYTVKVSNPSHLSAFQIYGNTFEYTGNIDDNVRLWMNIPLSRGKQTWTIRLLKDCERWAIGVSPDYMMIPKFWFSSFYGRYASRKVVNNKLSTKKIDSKLLPTKKDVFSL